MGRWVIGLCAAGALVAAAAASSQVVLAPTVYRSASVPSGSITTFAVTCQPGYVAVSAGVVNGDQGVTTLSIRPSSVRAFAFRFGNRSTNPARGVTVALACRKLAAGKGKSAPYLKAIPVKTKAVSVPGQSQKQLVLACPQGTVPGGGGVDLGSSSLELRRQTATLRRFTFSIRNDGSSAHSAVLYGNCLTVVLPQGSAPARLRVSLQTQSTPVPPKTIVIKRPCPSGWVALAAGFDLPKGLALRGAATVESGGKWTVDNKGDSQALADLQLTCARVA